VPFTRTLQKLAGLFSILTLLNIKHISSENNFLIFKSESQVYRLKGKQPDQCADCRLVVIRIYILTILYQVSVPVCISTIFKKCHCTFQVASQAADK